MELRRGDILLCDLGEGKGSEQTGMRPVIVIQNDIGNKYSPTIIVAYISSQIEKAKLPTHVRLGLESGLVKESFVMAEQQRTISKERIIRVVARATEEKMKLIDEAIKISLSLKQIDKHEEKVAREKADAIKSIDIFIDLWLSKNKPIEAIYDFIEDRRIKLIDLQRYCNSFRMDVKKFYDMTMVHQRVKINKMVG